MHDLNSTLDAPALKDAIRQAGTELGFAAVGFARADVGVAAGELRAWLAAGCHGEMDYMARHVELRAHPGLLHAGTVTVISAAVDYLPLAKMADTPGQAAISRYALGRDYHKVVRSRLQKLADVIAARIGPFGYRVFSDSAPVMEVHFAQQAGLGWRGKHTLLLSRKVPGVFSVKSTATCRCHPMRRSRSTAAPAAPVSTPARRKPSRHPIASMRGAASPT